MAAPDRGQGTSRGRMSRSPPSVFQSQSGRPCSLRCAEIKPSARHRRLSPSAAGILLHQGGGAALDDYRVRSTLTMRHRLWLLVVSPRHPAPETCTPASVPRTIQHHGKHSELRCEFCPAAEISAALYINELAARRCHYPPVAQRRVLVRRSVQATQHAGHHGGRRSGCGWRWPAYTIRQSV